MWEHVAVGGRSPAGSAGRPGFGGVFPVGYKRDSSLKIDHWLILVGGNGHLYASVAHSLFQKCSLVDFHIVNESKGRNNANIARFTIGKVTTGRFSNSK